MEETISPTFHNNNFTYFRSSAADAEKKSFTQASFHFFIACWLVFLPLNLIINFFVYTFTRSSEKTLLEARMIVFSKSTAQQHTKLCFIEEIWDSFDEFQFGCHRIQLSIFHLKYIVCASLCVVHASQPSLDSATIDFSIIQHNRRLCFETKCLSISLPITSRTVEYIACTRLMSSLYFSLSKKASLICI